MVFHWNLGDNKSQVSRILLSILADLSIVVIWMVSARPPISNSSNPLTKPLGLFQVHQLKVISPSLSIAFLVLWQGPSICLFVFFDFYCGPLGRHFFLWSIITRSGLLAEIRWSVCFLKSQRMYYYIIRVSFNRIIEKLL